MSNQTLNVWLMHYIFRLVVDAYHYQQLIFSLNIPFPIVVDERLVCFTSAKLLSCA